MKAIHATILAAFLVAGAAVGLEGSATALSSCQNLVNPLPSGNFDLIKGCTVNTVSGQTEIKRVGSVTSVQANLTSTNGGGDNANGAGLNAAGQIACVSSDGNAAVGAKGNLDSSCGASTTQLRHLTIDN